MEETALPKLGQQRLLKLQNLFATNTVLANQYPNDVQRRTAATETKRLLEELEQAFAKAKLAGKVFHDAPMSKVTVADNETIDSVMGEKRELRKKRFRLLQLSGKAYTEADKVMAALNNIDRHLAQILESAVTKFYTAKFPPKTPETDAQLREIDKKLHVAHLKHELLCRRAEERGEVAVRDRRAPFEIALDIRAA